MAKKEEPKELKVNLPGLTTSPKTVSNVVKSLVTVFAILLLIYFVFSSGGGLPSRLSLPGGAGSVVQVAAALVVLYLLLLFFRYVKEAKGGPVAAPAAGRILPELRREEAPPAAPPGAPQEEEEEAPPEEAPEEEVEEEAEAPRARRGRRSPRPRRRPEPAFEEEEPHELEVSPYGEETDAGELISLMDDFAEENGEAPLFALFKGNLKRAPDALLKQMAYDDASYRGRPDLRFIKDVLLPKKVRILSEKCSPPREVVEELVEGYAQMMFPFDSKVRFFPIICFVQRIRARSGDLAPIFEIYENYKAELDAFDFSALMNNLTEATIGGRGGIPHFAEMKEPYTHYMQRLDESFRKQNKRTFGYSGHTMRFLSAYHLAWFTNYLIKRNYAALGSMVELQKRVDSKMKECRGLIRDENLRRDSIDFSELEDQTDKLLKRLYNFRRTKSAAENSIVDSLRGGHVQDDQDGLKHSFSLFFMDWIYMVSCYKIYLVLIRKYLEGA